MKFPFFALCLLAGCVAAHAETIGLAAVCRAHANADMARSGTQSTTRSGAGNRNGEQRAVGRQAGDQP